MTDTEITIPSHAEVEPYQGGSTLTDQMNYARAVSVASLLPQAYRNKPADIMLAVGLGSAMGLTPAESLYRIDVIGGKPTASAELIAANVRKAGHRLRVKGDDKSCTATIIRSDDPEFEFTVTRDALWAKAMGLADKDNYKKQPGTMLQWRAITAVARLACPEALYGVAYSPDEMADIQPAQAASASAAERFAQVAAEDAPTETAVQMIAPTQIKKLAAAMGELGIKDRDLALRYVANVIGHEVESRNDLTRVEASHVIDAVERDLAGRGVSDQEQS